MANCGTCNHREVCRCFPNPEEYCCDFEPERPHGEWIPCSERLPEDEGKYLVSLNYGDVTMDSFIDGMFIMNLINVVAWMPLPSPYKKGGGEK